MTKAFLRNTTSILSLSFHLAKANFKLRNEGSYIGVLWYIIEPLIFFGVLLVVGNVLQQNTIPYYPVYLLIGLIMFNFFVAATTNASQSIVANASNIKNMKIASEAFVISGIMQFIFSHFFEFVLIVLLGMYLGINILWFLSYFILFPLFVLFVLGVSFVLSIWSIYMVDLKNIWNVCTRLLWFVTPIFYILPQQGLLKIVSLVNPMYHFINVTRDMIIFHTFNGGTFILACISSISVFLIGLGIFERNKGIIAEKI